MNPAVIQLRNRNMKLSLLSPETKYRVLKIDKVPKKDQMNYGFSERVILEVVD